ncbi:MAG: DUF6600 domain-containing protein [Arcticibacter sp.]
MKDLTRILMLLILGTVFTSLKSTGATLSQPGLSVSFQTFYDELAPYGQWINYQDQGRVWVPDVEEGFQPYGTSGHWVVTEYGNTWVSDYDWGWAPFHYGRWLFDDYYGWIWVPGSEWGPAWVNWRSGGGYYGWAPLGPGLDINININIPLSRWIFVPQRYITHRSVYSYCLPRTRYSNVYGHTTVINNIYVRDNRRYFAGPRRGEMERVTRGRIPVHQVRTADRPGRTVADRGSVRVYRPEVVGRNNGSSRGSFERPSRGTNEQYSIEQRNRRSGGYDNNAGGRPSSGDRNGNRNPSSGEREWNRNSPGNDRNTDRIPSAGDRNVNRDSWNRRNPEDGRSGSEGQGTRTNRPSRTPQGEPSPSATFPGAGTRERNTEIRRERPSGMTRPEGRSERPMQREQPQTRERSEGPQRSTPRVQSAPGAGSQSPDRNSSGRGSSSGERPSRESGRLTRG